MKVWILLFLGLATIANADPTLKSGIYAELAYDSIVCATMDSANQLRDYLINNDQQGENDIVIRGLGVWVGSGTKVEITDSTTGYSYVRVIGGLYSGYQGWTSTASLRTVQ